MINAALFHYFDFIHMKITKKLRKNLNWSKGLPSFASYSWNWDFSNLTKSAEFSLSIISEPS